MKPGPQEGTTTPEIGDVERCLLVGLYEADKPRHLACQNCGELALDALIATARFLPDSR